MLAVPRPAPRARRRILVTGAAGMLGSDLGPALAAAGHEVLARPKSDLDIADAKAVSRALRELAPDVVVNCAAFTKVDDCETDPRALEINAKAVGNLRGRLRARRRASSCRSRRTSSSTARRARRTPRKTRSHPLSEYGRTKRAGRRGGAAPARAASSCAPPGSSAACGLELRRGDPEAGRGRASRGCPSSPTRSGGPTATTDLSEAIVALLDAGASGIFHFANRGDVSWNEFAREILWAAGRGDVAVDAIDLGVARAPGAAPAVLRARHREVRAPDGTPDPLASASRSPSTWRGARGPRRDPEFSAVDSPERNLCERKKCDSRSSASAFWRPRCSAPSPGRGRSTSTTSAGCAASPTPQISPDGSPRRLHGPHDRSEEGPGRDAHHGHELGRQEHRRP